MHTFLPRSIYSLRIEKGISQKDAAISLGISPALLSHYENGIRECSLDFLCRCADFYEVTTDYLLGRTSERKKSQFSHETSNAETYVSDFEEYKRQLTGSLNLLIDSLSDSRSSEYLKGVNTYLSAAIYKTFRYYCHPELFLRQNSSVTDKQFPDIVNCVMSIAEMKMKLDGAKLPRAFSESTIPDTDYHVRSLMRDVELYCHAIIN